MIKQNLPRIIFCILQSYVLLITSYFLITGFFGFKSHKELPDISSKKKFLILVPAHNEESVISGIANNLKNLDYPKNLYDAMIIADGCTDNTALIAKKIGLKVITHNYTSGEIKGKPYAIRYALDKIKDYDKKYDGICFFDADNLISYNFLKEINKHLSSGQQLIQCYLDTKNPMDNWISLSFATNFYYMNRSFQLARNYLGLGASLGGTGFCIGTKLLKRIGWTAFSLTEDLEFQIQAILLGEKTYWCHTARVFDEKPTSFKASCEQRSRWARGHWDLIFKYGPNLLSKWISEKNIIVLDTLLYSLNPLHMLISGVALAYSLIAFIVGFPLKGLPINGLLWNILSLISFILIGFSIIKDVSKPLPKLLGLISMPFFNITYIPIVLWAFLTRNNHKWKRTEHSKNISLNLELEKTIKSENFK